MKEFKEFALKGNVMDMAIGVIIGGAFGTIVKSLVDDILMPLLGIILSGVNIAELAVTVPNPLGGEPVAATGVTLGFGIPVYRYYNSVNVGFELGQRGAVSNNLIRERYFLVTVSFNLHDIWFIPTLYN